MMKPKRLVLTALAASASAAALGLSASPADAALLTKCTGANITGQGSSLQRVAQNNAWGPNFNVSTAGCPGGPTATYTSTGSGAGLAGFGANDPATFSTANAFVGTDDAPDATQIANINSASGTAALTVPVTQAAIAIVLNPPAGCTVPFVKPAALEAAFRGSNKSWTALGATGSACSGQKITRVVRNDSSGTTYQLKHYLYTLNSGVVTGSSTWADLQAASLNTTWPGAVTRSKSGNTPGTVGTGAGSGGGDEVKTVANTPNSIGYVALSDARANLNYNPALPLKFARIGATTTVAQSPSSNGQSTTTANSNCNTNTGAYGTLPSGTASWADVYLTDAGGKYPLCTLTFDLALKDYSKRPFPDAKATATTVRDYLKYIATGTGQAANANKDYATLPTDARSNAQATIAQIVD